MLLTFVPRIYSDPKTLYRVTNYTYIKSFEYILMLLDLVDVDVNW